MSYHGAVIAIVYRGKWQYVINVFQKYVTITTFKNL